MGGPPLSVVMPVRDEAANLETSVRSLAGEIESLECELVVAEGGSRDGTPAVLSRLQKRYAWIRVVDNPGGHPATGLNRAIVAAGADTIVRADAHSHYAPTYIRGCLALLDSSVGDIVGGRLRPVGRTAFGRSVSEAMTNPWGVGPGRFHHAGPPALADTVYLGAYRRCVAEQLGGYRAFPSKAGEDADFCARARRAGLRVWFDPAIQTCYQVRESPVALTRQSFRYGRAKAEMLLTDRKLPSPRALAPAALGLALASAALPGGSRARGLVTLWLAALRMVGTSSDNPNGFLAAAGIMQSAYAAGFWTGLARGRARALPLEGPAAGWGPGD